MTRFVLVKPFHSGWEAGKLYWQQEKRWGPNKKKAKVYGERGAHIAWTRLRSFWSMAEIKVEPLDKGEYIRRYV